MERWFRGLLHRKVRAHDKSVSHRHVAGCRRPLVRFERSASSSCGLPSCELPGMADFSFRHVFVRCQERGRLKELRAGKYQKWTFREECCFFEACSRAEGAHEPLSAQQFCIEVAKTINGRDSEQVSDGPHQCAAQPTPCFAEHM